MDNSDDRIHPVRFGIFKLNQENRNETIGQWVETYDGFEDRAIFVDQCSSYSLTAYKFAGTKGNCIYFSDLVFADDVVPRVDNAYAYPGRFAWIFNIHDFIVKYLSALPGTGSPPIFLPPQAWLV